MPDTVYKQTVEFRLSDELFEEAEWIRGQNYLSQQQLAIGSVGLLNEAHLKNFRTEQTALLAPGGKEILLPSLVREDEKEWPHMFSVALNPKLHDPMVAYCEKRQVDIRERVRRAIRFGVFVLTYVAPEEGELVSFLHRGKPMDIPFHTRQ
jgi:hypothetical protein